MANSDQLRIPDAVSKDTNSFEILRVWVANKDQHMSLRVGVWDDPAAWGMMLADIARNIANCYQQDKGLDRSQSLKRIKAALDVELASSTDE